MEERTEDPTALEAALARSEEWRRAFLETAVDAIVTIDSRGLIESFNPAAERLFGYAAGEVVGANVNVLMPNPYRDEHDGYIASFLRTGEKRIIGIGREVEGRRKDGSRFPLHLSVAQFSVDGEVKFTGILRDLGPEREAQEREAGLARILEGSLNEIYVFDAETLAFLQVNRGARRNIGYSMDELASLTPLDLKPELTAEALEELIQPLRTGARETVTFTTHHLRKDGSAYPIEAHVQLTSYDGRDAFAAVILDISQRERMQVDLLHAQKMEAVGRLSGSLAHDFNNLLMGVISGCRMVARMTEGNREAQELLAEIQKEAHVGAGMTRQLLDFSRKRSYQLSAVDVHALVQDTASMLKKLVGEDIELVVRVDRDGGAIQADADKLKQILMNLVVNARDAMKTGGKLTIEVANTGPERIALSVSDTGCGMDKATADKVFEPFFTTKEAGKGTGLGLATVFGLTREFGGEITIESEVGAGTTFHLDFPRTRESSAATGTVPVAKRKGAGTVLLVEDESLVRAGVRHLLGELGYKVVDAASPRTALEQLAALEGELDLLLTDIVMPGMSGPDLAKRVQELHPGVKVLFMSAYSDEALVEQGRIDSGKSVLQKPFEDEELAHMVRRALSS